MNVSAPFPSCHPDSKPNPTGVPVPGRSTRTRPNQDRRPYTRHLAGLVLTLSLCRFAAATPGDLDPAFAPPEFTAVAALATAVTPDGAVFVGGWMETTNAIGDPVTGLARLNPDGSADELSAIEGTIAVTSALAVDSEGRTLWAGLPTDDLDASVRPLNPDGSFDDSFRLVASGTVSPWIYALAPQPDGRFLVAGSFTRVNGVPRTNLFRATAEGTLDGSFRTNFTCRGDILALALQGDGRVVIAGNFTNVLGVVRRGVARLNADGSLDSSFDPGSGVAGLVRSLAVQADGRILLGGQFYGVQGAARSCLARLLPNGAIDTSFRPGEGAQLLDPFASADGPSVNAILLQGDGRILAAGHFDSFAKWTRPHLVRLHWQGEVDEDFDPGTGPDGPIQAMALDADGNLVIAGAFSTVRNTVRTGVARLTNDGTLPVLPTILAPPSDQIVTVGRSSSFTVEATGTPALRYQWLKSGLPIRGQTNATFTLAGAQLADAGRYSVAVSNLAGVVISDGAQLTVHPAPVAPVILTQPRSQMVAEGASVTLEASASGTQPLAWQWKIGTTEVTGATDASLAFPEITALQAGSYSARVTNAAGAATTAAASVVVFRPPVDQVAWAGSNVTFKVETFGPGPFGYQWRFNDSPLPGAIKPTLLLTNVSLDLAGAYSVVLSNLASRATSPPAQLVVNMAPRIVGQPADTGAIDAGSLSLEVAAIGSEPLTYQWRLQGLDLPDATDPTLVLDPVTGSDAGYYSVVVRNDFGAVTSRVATVTVEGPTLARLALGDASGFAAGTVSVPLHLVGAGDENTIAFSLAFDPALLTLQSVSNGPAIGTDASVILNTTLSDQGRIGVLLARAPGQTFAAGSNLLLTVQFEIAGGLAAATITPIDFDTVPIPPGLLSTAVRPLPVAYQAGSVTIEAGWEADLSPGPNGDGEFTLEDWSLVAQIVAGLVAPADESEFARVDCAPLETRGDGQLAAADWTQAGRFVAGIDEPVVAGGPSAVAKTAGLASIDDDDPSDDAPGAEAVSSERRRGLRLQSATGPTRQVMVSSAQPAAGANATVTVSLQAAGDENTAGFTLNFDPARVRFRGASAGSGLGTEASLILNTNLAVRGKVGVLLGRKAGTRFEPGRHELLRLEFAPTGTGPSTVGFGDQPVLCELVSSDARVLDAAFLAGRIEPLGLPTVPKPKPPTVRRNGSVAMSWEVAQPGRYVLESSTDLEHWTILTVWNANAAGTLEYDDTQPGAWRNRFFRVR